MCFKEGYLDMTLPLLDLGQSKLKGALIKGLNMKNFILKVHRTNAIMKVMIITPHYDVIRVILRQKSYYGAHAYQLCSHPQSSQLSF